MNWDFQEWMNTWEAHVPEFFPPSYWPLSQDERNHISDAALLSHSGDEVEAERARERAGYGGLR